MPDIIQLLPDSIANQIAAGEVVQRPSSAVKEMLENSVDAGATSIQLIIKNAGKSLIQVMDDGKGMSEMDARMCFERHATSKITKTEDLFNIHTYGFRGEAMASIAAVAQVELKTKREEDEVGTLIKIEGSKLTTQEEVACSKGTSIAIKNLFFNVPARRNFLKSNPVETRHIIDEFQRVALAYPELSMQLYQNDLETFHLPGGKLSQRIVNLFGKNYQQQLAKCEEQADKIKVWGYIGKPESAKKTRGEQFFFANRRFIRHHYLNHAVLDAFEGLLPNDTYPFYVLNIELPASMIDINVHPTKTEVKFEDERLMYGVVKAAVKKALGVHNITPSIDFDREINFSFGSTSKKPNSFSSVQKETELDRSNKINWEKLYEDFSATQEKKEVIFKSSIQSEEAIQAPITFQSALNSDEKISNEETATDCFQLHNKYIISQVRSGVLLIDMAAAHERILYEKYQELLENSSGGSQQCLFPPTISLNPSDYELVFGLKEEMAKLGFLIEDFGNNTIIINGIPQDLTIGEEKKVFEELIEQFKLNMNELKVSRKENLARIMSKKLSKKEGSKLLPEEMESLVDRLFACKQPEYTSDGYKTFTIISLLQLANFF